MMYYTIDRATEACWHMAADVRNNVQRRKKCTVIGGLAQR